jgi:hypothetical protein
MPTIAKSCSGVYIWDGRTVRLACGMPTLLSWAWVNHLGGGWKETDGDSL